MSDFHSLTAEIREDVGKGASRRLRHAGRIPAVIYGGDRDPVALTLEHRQVWHAAENEAFFSSILEIRVGDDITQQVVVRDMQRHPFKSAIMHMDFMRVSATETLRISLPLHFIGEDESEAGKTAGVVIQHQLTEVEIEALPKDLPEFLAVDLSGLAPGDAVMLADIKLPAGVVIPELTDDEDSNVMVANAVHVSEDQGSGDEDDGEAAEDAGIADEDDAGDEGGEAAEDRE